MTKHHNEVMKTLIIDDLNKKISQRKITRNRGVSKTTVSDWLKHFVYNVKEVLVAEVNFYKCIKNIF